MARRLRWLMAATCAVAAGCGSSGAAVGTSPAVGQSLDWTTYRHDAARSGVDPDSTSPVTPTQAWQTPALDGAIYGQPLLYGADVYVATENDTVYALNALTGAVVWQKHLATPVASSQLPCGDISTVGITSTPVIDPAAGKIFVVAEVSASGGVQHQLFGLNLSDGGASAPITVDPPGAIPKNHLQRAGLALEAGKVVIGYGGNFGDCGTYHGWLVAVPESGGALQTFQVDPSPNNGGAIWGAGNAPPVDSSGDVWTSTGNGTGSSTSNGGQESVVRLDANLGVLDHWSPSNWASLDSSDTDLGSSMPVLLPSGLVFQIGKAGVGYLLSASALGGTGGTPAYQASVCSGGSYGGGIYVNRVIYVACSDGMHALSLDIANHRFSPLAGWSVGHSAQGPPIFAGGLVWSADWGSGTLYGLDPASGAAKFSAGLGGFEHFASPSAGGGGLFVANRDRVTALHIANVSPTAPTPPSSPPPRPAITHLKVKVVGHKLRLTFSLSESATVIVRLAARRWVLHAHRGHDRFLLRWRKLARGRHRLRVVAKDAAARRSKTYFVSFQLR